MQQFCSTSYSNYIDALQAFTEKRDTRFLKHVKQFCSTFPKFDFLNSIFHSWNISWMTNWKEMWILHKKYCYSDMDTHIKVNMFLGIRLQNKWLKNTFMMIFISYDDTISTFWHVKRSLQPIICRLIRSVKHKMFML